MSISCRGGIFQATESRGIVDGIMVMQSRREKIQELLRSSKNPLSVEDIIALLGEHYDQETIYEDIDHIAKTVYATSRGRECVVMIPPNCRACGFMFKGLKKPRRPRKCPQCRSERIKSPLFKISEK